MPFILDHYKGCENGIRPKQRRFTPNRKLMNRLLIATIALAASGGGALAASVTNNDSEPRLLIVTEGGSKSELSLAAGETVNFCSGGCFVTMPNGDHEALTGTETIEISGGRAVFR